MTGMILAAFQDGIYQLLLILHIASVVIAFAPAVAHPLMGAEFDKQGSQTQFAGVAAKLGRRVYSPALIASGLFGILLLLQSDEVFEFSDAWVSGAFLVWIAMVGIVQAVILPSERKVAAGEGSAMKKVQTGGMVVTLLFFVMLWLMVVKPGA